MGRRKKHRTHRVEEIDPSVPASVNPKTLIIHRGVHARRELSHLVEDLRRVFEPFTATRLRVKKKNKLKDFISISHPLGVTHLLLLSATELAPYLRVVHCPHGPTLTFRITSYSYVSDCLSSQRRAPALTPALFHHPPLVVLNNFKGSLSHHRQLSDTLQNIFPPINVHTVHLKECKRVLLFNYNMEDDSIEVRHYAVRLTHVGMSRSVKKLMVKKSIPHLGNLEDVSEIIEGVSYASSDSEADDGNTVEVPDMGSDDTGPNHRIAVRLFEIGPRMTMELMRVEEGVSDGKVLYHRLVTKTEEEVEQLESRAELRKQRKAEQEANMKRKMLEAESKKQAKREKRIKKRKREEKEDVSDDDKEYYRQEVGREMDDIDDDGTMYRKRMRGKGNERLPNKQRKREYK